MRATIHPGRFTAQADGEFVVFLIGMRINRIWKPRRWWPVFAAMPPMIRELEAHPEKGMLHAQPMLTHQPVGSAVGQSAAKRIGASAEDETAVEPY